MVHAQRANMMKLSQINNWKITEDEKLKLYLITIETKPEMNVHPLAVYTFSFNPVRSHTSLFPCEHIKRTEEIRFHQSSPDGTVVYRDTLG